MVERVIARLEQRLSAEENNSESQGLPRIVDEVSVRSETNNSQRLMMKTMSTPVISLECWLLSICTCLVVIGRVRGEEAGRSVRIRSILDRVVPAHRLITKYVNINLPYDMSVLGYIELILV